MQTLTVLLVTFGSVCGDLGDVYFNDIYKDDQKLPKDKAAAVQERWTPVTQLPQDQELHIQWYKHNSSVQLAYDKAGYLAGVRLVIPKKGDDSFYKSSRIFKEVSIDGQTCFIASVFVNDPEGILKLLDDGQDKTEDDEIVAEIHVKVDNGYERIQRDACDNYKQGTFKEQKCKNNYGLIFAPINEDNKNCDYPLLLMYNEKEQGEMLGFGWLVPSSDVSGNRALTTSDISKMFSTTLPCLREKTVVNIWFAREHSKVMQCTPNLRFVEERCQPKRRQYEQF